MCELCIQLVDRVHHDPYEDVMRYKAGDVIEILEDGADWGKEPPKNPEWRIVRLPGVSVRDAAAFLASEKNTDPSNPSRVLQRRAFKFDLSKLPKNGNVVAGTLSQLKIAKSALVDPNVIG